MLVEMSVSEEVSPVVEEYLECIFKLQEKSAAARTSDIVKSLGVVPGTVTNTVEWLEKEGLVRHKPYKGARLTEKGRKIALQVIRRHRLSERLLTDILHMEWDKVHNAACRLEHAMTDEVMKPLEKTLGHPKTCPHGNPIPTKCGGIIEEESSSLIDLAEGEEGTIMKITEEKADMLRYLNAMGLVPGAHLKVVGKAPFNGPITVRVDRTNRALSREVASIIRVRKAS
jgi:DtxR family Mn-dependent transcriptional regulator